MAEKAGLMIVAGRGTPESNQMAGMMIWDDVQANGFMEVNTRQAASDALVRATGFMIVNYANNGDGFTLVRSNT